MAFPIIPKRRSGSAGNPTSLQLGELAVNTATGKLYLGADGGVAEIGVPVAAGTTVTEYTGDGTTVAFTFSGYNGTDDGGYLVSVGGIDQPPSKYSITDASGGTITFVEPPVAGELISIRAIVAGSGGGGSGNATSLQGRPVLNQAPDANMSLTWVNDNWQPSFTLELSGSPLGFPFNPTAGNLLRFNGTEWAPFDGTVVPNWNQSLLYDVGAVVYYNGVIWECRIANSNAAPGQTGAGYWANLSLGVAYNSPQNQATPANWLFVETVWGSGYIPFYQ